MDANNTNGTNWITYTTTGGSSGEPIWISDLVHQPSILPQPIWNEVDQLFDRFVRNFPQQVVVEDAKFPKCNAWTSEDGLCIDLAVPYTEKDDIEIDVDTRLRKVTIAGQAHQEDDVEYLKREISRTSFRRTFLVGQEFDLAKMKAQLEDGLLKITIPHSEEEKTRFKKIAVR